ncbi:MAG: tRNA (adenosine(37)-N6)-threonylcarbamoyltransferase complex transferase subunit TsaD, partial [Clostridia bacterium]|nr:tRNA (adenosine(37)-N6)-threonylcarbamoyltransferase complex transferase subunit TsaD [Clostridia bacterium]
DKVARILSLPYPGGPHVEKLAREGNANVALPKMLKGQGGYDFSYSGLKTAVLNYVHNSEQRGEEWSRADVACSFQHAALDILVQKTVEAALEHGVTTVTAGGGVIANGFLREALATACEAHGLKLVLPEKRHCTDNAAMIAAEGLIQYKAGRFSPLTLNAQASIPLRQTLQK